MEKKPNNEISELLARLQQHVEEPSAPETDDTKPAGGESTQELLSLLKKNLGATDNVESVSPENREYSIEGYEFDEEDDDADPVSPQLESGEDSCISCDQKKDNDISPEQEKDGDILIEKEEDNDIFAEQVKTVKNEYGLSESPAESSLQSGTLPMDSVSNSVVSVHTLESEHEQQAEPDEPSLESIVEKSQELQEAQDVKAVEEISESVVSDGNEAVWVEEAANTEESILNSETLNAQATLGLAEKAEEDNQENKQTVQADTPKEEHTTVDQTASEADTEYADIYLSEAMVKRFFRFRRLKNEQDGTERNEIFDKPDFDDTDINLALSLGSKEDLENSIGYERVRSARNGFYDPLLDEATGDRTYGYCGEEFRSYEQIDAIKKKYITEYGKIIKGFVFTFVLAVIILFWEHLPKTGIEISFFSNLLQDPLYYYGGAVLFSILLIACSFRQTVKGIQALISLHGDPNVVVSCVSVLGLIYHLIVFIFFRDEGLLTYNFAVALFMLFGMVDGAMRLVREKLSFDVVSERKPKLSLEQLEGAAYSETVDAFFAKQNFFVEKIDFVGNFFSRSGRRPQQFSEYFHEMSYSVLAAIVVSVFTVCLTKNMSLAVTAFMFTTLMCVPMQFLIVNVYPFYHLSKGLSKLGSAVIGDAAAEEYNDADTIYLDDSEMFGKHGARVTGLRAYNDMDFYEILSYALSVFTLIGAPLCNVFDNSAKEIVKKDDVKITGITFGGVEAIVDLFKPVYIGNLAFMRNHGFFPKQSLDDKTKSESGQVSILYMAVGEELCAKFYVQYTVTQRFEKFAAEMLKNGIHVGIRSLDPNVNAKMIATLRNDKDISIKVIRPTPNELIPIGKHSESGIVTSKNPHMIFKILEQCFNIKQIHIRQRTFRRLSLLLGVLVSLIVMLAGQYTHIPSLYVAIYQLLWLVPALIYTKSNLK